MTEEFNSQSTTTAVDFDPFAGGEVLLTAPTTESQKEIWASVQMSTAANCAYNESQTLCLKGDLNVDVLKAAAIMLIERHESLRTTFAPNGETLCINDSLEIEIPFYDLSSLNSIDQETEFKKLCLRAVSEPFNLEFGPLFRVEVIHLNPQKHRVILTAHHIVCDGWSWAVMMADLGTLYSALQRGDTPDLDAPERFSDYAIALNEESAETTETLEYWLAQFHDSVPILDFPTDYPRPPLRTFESAREDLDLPLDLVVKLKQLGTESGCSFMTTMLTSFELFLHRLTGQPDVMLGVPAAGQAATGNYNLVGHCVNLLPLKSRVDNQSTFRDYLSSRKSTILDAYDHQRLTFGSLVQKLSIPRDSSRIPLVPIQFNIDQGLDAKKLPFNNLDVDFFSNPRTYENFEIFINATELHGKLTLECQYNTNLFTAETIRRRLLEFQTLLAGIVAHPDTSIATLPILPDKEFQQVVLDWNNTATDYPKDQCIHRLFESQVARNPEAIALTFENQQLTYQALNQRANQLAHYLQNLGVTSGQLVGICVDRSFDMIIGLLAILKAGGAYLPLDPQYPAERLAFMLEDTQIQVLLSTRNLAASLPTDMPHVVCLEAIAPDPDPKTQENLAHQNTATSLAYVMYTSGSTGKPKGVSIPHRGVVRLVQNTNYVRITADDVFLQLAAFAFDAATFEIWGALLNGASLVLFPQAKPTLAAMGQAIAQHNITILWLTAGLFHLIVDECIEELKPVRQLLAGGDVLSVPHVKKVIEQLPNCTLINGYGPTENTTFTCCYTVSDGEKITPSVPIGRPIANTQVYILDKNLQPVPIGIPGELCTGGDGLAQGYFQQPELTQERFIPNPFSDANDYLYRTGDMVRYLADGNIEFLGRIDNQVKIRGFRIELDEIKAALNQYPELKEATVIVREDQPGEKVLVTYFVPLSNNTKEPNEFRLELRQFLKGQLPDFMVPSHFVTLEKLPLNANGKIDTKRLPKPDASQQLTATYIAPSNDLERQIADIWSEVLSIKQIGIHDNFFELGGYSLLAIQIVSRLRKTLQIEILLSHLFELPTIAELARRVQVLRWAIEGSQAPHQTTDDDTYEEGEL